MYDWSQAYDRLCPKNSILSFINNGVRKSLLPVLISYFQDRRMVVKWHQKLSSVRDLPGGVGQGCRLGQETYCSQVSSSAATVPDDDKYCWIDDLSVIEIINLVSVGLSMYNFKQHVASDIGIDQKYLSSDNINSQD